MWPESALGVPNTGSVKETSNERGQGSPRVSERKTKTRVWRSPVGLRTSTLVLVAREARPHGDDGSHGHAANTTMSESGRYLLNGSRM